MALQSTVLTCVAAVAQVDIIFLRLRHCLTANAEVATVLGSIPVSSDTVESEARQLKQYIEKIQKSPYFNFFIGSRIAPAISRFK